MKRHATTVEEVIYTLTPEEVIAAIRAYVESRPAEGYRARGAVAQGAVTAIGADGSATVTSRYAVQDNQPQPGPARCQAAYHGHLPQWSGTCCLLEAGHGGQHTGVRGGVQVWWKHVTGDSPIYSGDVLMGLKGPLGLT